MPLTNPTNPLQYLSTRLLVDASTTSLWPVYVTLLSLPITMRGGRLDVRVSSSINTFNTSNQPVFGDIAVDGVQQVAFVNNMTGTLRPLVGQLPATFFPPGLHTVAFRWCIAAVSLGAARCSAATNPSFWSANMIIQELVVPP